MRESLYSGCAQFLMIIGARSRGERPRRSASPCSVTTTSKSCSIGHRKVNTITKLSERRGLASLIDVGREWDDAADSARVCLARASAKIARFRAKKGSKQIYTYVEGVCMIDSFAFRRKSAEPLKVDDKDQWYSLKCDSSTHPRPLSILYRKLN